MKTDEVLTGLYNALCQAIDGFEKNGVTEKTAVTLRGINVAVQRGIEKAYQMTKKESTEMPDFSFDISRFIPVEAKEVIAKMDEQKAKEDKAKKDKENLEANLKAEIANLRDQLAKVSELKAKESQKPKKGKVKKNK